jgi:hypothetical protein
MAVTCVMSNCGLRGSVRAGLFKVFKLRGAGESFPCWGSLRGQRPLKVLVFKGFTPLRGLTRERGRRPLCFRLGEDCAPQGCGGERGACPPMDVVEPNPAPGSKTSARTGRAKRPPCGLVATLPSFRGQRAAGRAGLSGRGGASSEGAFSVARCRAGLPGLPGLSATGTQWSAHRLGGHKARPYKNPMERASSGASGAVPTRRLPEAGAPPVGRVPVGRAT